MVAPQYNGTLLTTGNGTRVLPPPTDLPLEGASAFESIPIIDLEEPTDIVVQKIRDACLKVGFFYIKNHGIPQSTIDKTLTAAHQFFALPDEQKQALDIHLSESFKGYTALLGENTDPANRGDLHEGFDVGSESESGDALRGNVWPPAELLPGFRETVMAYFDAVLQLGKRLFPLFALSLSLPEDFFNDKILHPAAIMRLLHYPSQSGPVDDRVLGIGAHTDYECFTLLYQDRVPALQVLNAAGKWVAAPPIEGTFVCNLGDQFARWTNDVYVSTVHRAINRTGRERYSIPFFFGTDYDVKLEALPSCVSEDRPPRYEVVTAGDYVKSRLEETYAHSKK